MDKVLKAIGGFFKRIWEWIKNTAWVQPVLIVSLIFAVIFSINPIIKGVKSALNSGNKEGAFYKAHDTKFSSIHIGEEENGQQITLNGKQLQNNKDCLVVYVDLANKADEAYSFEKYLKNFSSQHSEVKIFVVNTGSKDYLDDDEGQKNNDITYNLYEPLYDGDKNNENCTAYLPTEAFDYDIKYSAWEADGENQYLNGNTDNIALNSPTFVKYKDGKPVDMRFDLSSYKDKNDKQINEVTILNDLWNGTNKN